MTSHTRIDMGVAVPTSPPRDLGSTSSPGAGAGGGIGTTRALRPENDPRTRKYIDG